MKAIEGALVKLKAEYEKKYDGMKEAASKQAAINVKQKAEVSELSKKLSVMEAKEKLIVLE